MMSGIVMGDQLFTIEQMELLRRLRNSGITKEQVSQAFDSFDRLDKELGTLYTVPISISSQVPRTSQTFASYAVNSLHSSSTREHKESSSNGGDTWKNTQEMQPSHSKASDNFHVHVQQRINDVEGSPRGIKRSVIDLADHNSADQGGFNDQSESNDSHAGSTCDANGKEIDEFFKIGKINMIHEVRNFVESRNLQLSQIAILTGLGAHNIQKFLHSPPESIEDPIVLAMASWYTSNKKMVNELFDHSSSHGSSYQTQYRPYIENMEDQGELFLPRQRDRFRFTATHLQILESYFNQNSYPKFSERIAIAAACNSAASMDGKMMLTEKQKVSPHTVQNWFSNRRKDLKKLAREEGVPETEVVLQSRLKLVKPGTFENILSPNFGKNDSIIQDTSPSAHSGPDQGGDNCHKFDGSNIVEENLMLIKDEPV